MYYCENCYSEFETPQIVTETHGLTSPPFETICVCPFCSSTKYRKIKVRYCKCCGARVKEAAFLYCSENCRIVATKLNKKEEARQKAFRESPLVVLIREVEKYNKENNAKLSYGQYVALVKPKLREDRNAKKETLS